MPPMNAARRRALQAVLSAIAGGGLTAAGLGGPLAGAALASETTTTPATTETTTTPAPTPTETTPRRRPDDDDHTGNDGEHPAGDDARDERSGHDDADDADDADHDERPGAAKAGRQADRDTQGGPETAPAQHERRHQDRKHHGGHDQGGQGSGRRQQRRTSPQAIAAQASALASTEASIQALGFYRIPLFLLPIYKSAAIQYGVPWQILAAINEIETDYGTDLSISSAGAVGWMQFMPATWLQYGVDALNAGYADPYNPVDAIFAAARYLRAAGASTNLPAAILAYNHSAEYVELGVAARQADLGLPAFGDRDAHGPRRRPPAGDRPRDLLERPARARPPAASATAGAAPVPLESDAGQPRPAVRRPHEPGPGPGCRGREHLPQSGR